ncbi:nitroreductase [Xylanimonas cellulosilytica DSM 15894]|uniref:Nitroreductase n=1 Tax=Xylanimonas cellulosilytica (strain DSM 15894 / JCM 12276 / CECT 5975 / KCTC 9989 / LMG 20990 / NBRC 107835 / XIL07) TaxID=446471 RepID=D1BXA7_XYLCX|nr:malonic semialdehyde reductase [Xylanimonas cellulosilytica]ACZ29717.1 nitroreductase [Xylanimonas cellulosilytica DSM 15894]
MTVALSTTADLAIDETAADLLFRTARTTSQWTDAPVTDDELAAAWDLAKFGPTAMNSLPLRFAVVRSAEERARLVELMPDGNKSRVESAPVTLVLAYDHDFHEHMDTLFPHAPGIKDQFAPAEEMRHGMGSLNAHLQAGYLLVGLRAAGLAAGPMHAADYAGVDAAFFAGTGFKSFLVVNVGHADGEGTTYPRLPRFDLDEVSISL